MRKSQISKLFFALMLMLMLALVACSNDTGGDGGDSADSDDNEAEEENGEDEEKEEEDGLYSIDDFDNIKNNEGEEIDGGSITFGLVSDTAFEGTLNWNFYSGNPDAKILEWFDEGLLTWDEDYVYTNDGGATYEQDEENENKFIFTIKDEVNWHDGEPVTAEDWEFAHEVIGDPDYDGPRYGKDFTNIEGMEEYHAGDADKISGIEVIDDKILEITYIDVTPSLVTGGIWTYPMAKHIFGDMDVADMSSSPEVRDNPIGFGPFKVDSITPGEAVTLTKNEDYWRGEPKLDEVTIKVIDPSVVVNELESGGVDTVSEFPAAQYPDNADMSNVEFLGIVDRSYSYIGFKLGTWNKEEKQVETDIENAKMGDKNLRQAMWHAVDNDAVGDRFYHGLRWGATTLIPPSHPEFHDDSNEGRPYDPEKAKELLDEAGYEEGDDGFRTDPDGNELVINFASMSGDDVAEPLAKYYIQAWEEVGLKVELLDGRLHEFNTFYERVGEGGDDDPEVDIYAGAWGVGIDVDPRGLYGEKELFNFSRWSDEENDRLLAAGVSEEAFDVAKRQEAYNEWQELMVEEVPVFPTLYRSEIVPVNNRVHNYSIGDGTGMYRYEIAVSEEESLTAE